MATLRENIERAWQLKDKRIAELEAENARLRAFFEEAVAQAEGDRVVNTNKLMAMALEIGPAPPEVE